MRISVPSVHHLPQYHRPTLVFVHGHLCFNDGLNLLEWFYGRAVKRGESGYQLKPRSEAYVVSAHADWFQKVVVEPKSHKGWSQLVIVA